MSEQRIKVIGIYNKIERVTKDIAERRNLHIYCDGLRWHDHPGQPG